MKITNFEEKDGKLTFDLEDSDPSIANSLRRAMLREIPVMAIDEIDFFQNSSTMWDEQLAHRIGMVALETPENYELPETEEDRESSKCSTIVSLSSKGPGTVYAEKMELEDSEVEIVHPKTPLIKLSEDQEIELEGRAIMGTGKEHAKYKCCLATYTTDTDKDAKEDPEDTFKFTVESYVKRSPKEILKEAIDILIEKSGELQDKIESGDA